jgi:dihydroorotate dehydrogenase
MSTSGCSFRDAHQGRAVILAQTVFGLEFQNPVLLASGTCGYGAELDGFFDIDRLGGLVIKAVTADVRIGNPAPRVAEFHAGMLNSVGLANPGPDAVIAEKLPWLAGRLRRAKVLVNVAGRTAEEYGEIIRRCEDAPGFDAYELNVSCPNVKEGGAIIATRPDLLADAVRSARRATPGPSSSSSRRTCPTLAEWQPSARPKAPTGSPSSTRCRASCTTWSPAGRSSAPAPAA